MISSRLLPILTSDENLIRPWNRLGFFSFFLSWLNFEESEMFIAEAIIVILAGL